jgi:hypothetical protein
MVHGVILYFWFSLHLSFHLTDLTGSVVICPKKNKNL